MYEESGECQHLLTTLLATPNGLLCVVFFPPYLFS